MNIRRAGCGNSSWQEAAESKLEAQQQTTLDDRLPSLRIDMAPVGPDADSLIAGIRLDRICEPGRSGKGDQGDEQHDFPGEDDKSVSLAPILGLAAASRPELCGVKS